MERINRAMKIEDFLKQVMDMIKEKSSSFVNMNDAIEYTVDKIANELRYSESKAQVIKVEMGSVEIANGVYAGNKATILDQKDNRLEVKIDGDQYENKIMIDVDDLKYTNEEIKNIYILE